MSQFERIYIGKGSKITDLDIERVSIAREDLEVILNDHVVEYKEKEYFIFESGWTKGGSPILRISAKWLRILKLYVS